MTTQEIDLEIVETEEKLKKLRELKRERGSIDDIKKLFYDKVVDAINDEYEQYRVASVYELISVPYDNTNHMKRWVIYSTDAPNALNRVVMRIIDGKWKEIYRKSVLKGTNGRAIGIKNKRTGEIQVSQKEMLAIREIAAQAIDQLLEDWFGS